MAKTKAKAPERDRDAELQEIGRNAFESIAEMVGKLEAMQQVSDCCDADMTAVDKDGRHFFTCDSCDKPCEPHDGDEPDDDAREEAQQEIQEDPLSIEVRSAWYSPGEDPGPPGEFKILLATGGPAVRIIGDLDMHGEPMRARLEAQDWYTPWTEYRGARGSDVVLTYARQFVYGVG